MVSCALQDSYSATSGETKPTQKASRVDPPGQDSPQLAYFPLVQQQQNSVFVIKYK